MSNRLNVLTVGVNPNLIYYSYKLNNTGDFKFHILNEEIIADNQIILANHKGSPTVFNPDHIYSDFNQLTLQTKFDIVFLSSKSLQDISNLSSNLLPFLSTNSIILIESTGFVNLEPFLKNCLPSNSSTSIFSIMSNLDIRKLDQNQYIVQKTAASPEIIIGESNTNNAKYQSNTLSNLISISKIFQSASNNDYKLTIKNTYLEFLTEQWKLAIPQICFNPLLILFEESNPENLSNQILAKPLLSGLVTELITVAKTMGCRLPIGYDNESNLLRRWCDLYSKPTSNEIDPSIKFLESPSFFYNFYYKNHLDIDMLLLQPILLADDYGIKTPYLEFLYATICQFDKFNHTNEKSIFFKRSNDNELKNLIKSNDILTQKINLKETELNDLGSKLKELNLIQQKHKDKDSLLGQLSNNVESLKAQNQQLQQQLQQQMVKSKQLQAQVQQQQQIQQQQQQQLAQQSSTVDRSVSSDEQPVNNHSFHNIKHSIEGTPDLRDLTDAALISASMESPIKQGSNQESQLPQQAPPTLPNGNVFQENDSANGLQPPHIVPQLSSKELELQKKEQLLHSKEMELNKKLSQLNRYPQQQAPPQQPQFQTPYHQQNGNAPPQGGLHHPSPLYSVQNSSRNQVIPGPNGLQQIQQSQLTNGLPNASQNGFQNGNYFPQQQPQHPGPARRVSTMPVLDSNEMFTNPQFKKTSRKNRKSSFPLVTPGMDDNYGMPMQANLNNRFRNHYPAQSSVSGITAPQHQQQQQQQPGQQPGQQPTNQPQSQQIQQPYRPNPTKAFTSPTIPTENPYSASNSNSNSSNELNQLGNTSQPPIEENAKPLGIIGSAHKEEEKKKKKKGLFRKK